MQVTPTGRPKRPADAQQEQNKSEPGRAPRRAVGGQRTLGLSKYPGRPSAAFLNTDAQEVKNYFNFSLKAEPSSREQQ